jgi:hypothetical protein
MIGWIDPWALDEDGKVLSPRGMARYRRTRLGGEVGRQLLLHLV